MMTKGNVSSNGKHSRQLDHNEYPGEEHDELYLQMLRADQFDHEGVERGEHPLKSKKVSIRAVSLLLTSPYRSIRKGLRFFIKKNPKSHQP